jgi:hypothetical protein
MVELGNVANIEAWTNQQDATERYGRAYTSAEDEDPDDAWPAFQLIEFWSEQWRANTTPSTAPADHPQRSQLPAVHPELGVGQRAPLRRLRHRHPAGDSARGHRLRRPTCRPDQDRVRPLRGQAAAHDPPRHRGRPVRRPVEVPSCKHYFDVTELRDAHGDAEVRGRRPWLHQVDAIALLRSQDRPERTVRQWLADGVGEAYCDPVTHEVWVWWPALWTKHLEYATPQPPLRVTEPDP